jgi:protein-S-isoprenylcysteine O-methyltransferase Ste14
MVKALVRWASRTPVLTFILYPVAVVLFQLLHTRGKLKLVPSGALLLPWGYLQYRLAGRYRHPRAGGSSGMEIPPERLVVGGVYRYTRNPMYLGHMIFIVGLAVTFRSWFALVLLAPRAAWFQKRVLRDEARLEKLFGDEYVEYTARVKRWLPGIL